MGKGKKSFLFMLISTVVLALSQGISFGQVETTPLQFLKQQEMKHREIRGEVYLGNVLTLNYPAYSEEAPAKYHALLLELTDVLQTPLRKSYRLVLKGYTDSRGSADINLKLSRQRGEKLKGMLIKKYYMPKERITFEGHGADNQVASNATAEGRRQNRRVEIHVYGDVSQAVRFIETEEETK
ncbi:OmpA family protein [Thermodesulfobacteriota bacterium]